jgi:hypothetical protein
MCLKKIGIIPSFHTWQCPEKMLTSNKRSFKPMSWTLWYWSIFWKLSCSCMPICLSRVSYQILKRLMVRLLDRTYMKPVLASVEWSTVIWTSKSSTRCVKGFRNQRMSASYITIQDTSSVVRPHGYIVQAPIHNMHKANGFVLHLVTRIPNYSHHIKETKLHPHNLHRATKSIVLLWDQANHCLSFYKSFPHDQWPSPLSHPFALSFQIL